MAAWAKLILQMFIFAAVILVGYNLLKTYVLTKVKVNKWIILAVAVIMLILPNILAVAFGIKTQNNIFLVYVPSALFIVFFLWFMDLSGWNNRRNASNRGNKSNGGTYVGYGKKGSSKDVVIKPKAKPNRIKNKNE